MLTTSRLIATAVLTGGLAVAAHAALEQASGVMRTDLQRHDPRVPGYEAIQARIDIAPGAVAPQHMHPGEEIIYVLAGSLQYQVGDGAWRTFNTGGVLFIPAGTTTRPATSEPCLAPNSQPTWSRRASPFSCLRDSLAPLDW